MWVRPTPVWRFYRNDARKVLGNPMRRWLYHYLAGGALLAGVGYLAWGYHGASREASRGDSDAGHYLCSSSMVDVLLLLPFNRLSHAFGSLVGSDHLPAAVQRRAIAFLVWYYAMDLSESASDHYDTLQEVYTRAWKPGARPIAADAVVNCPCDGIVLSVQDDVAERTLVQVKGWTYGIESLFHVRPPPVPPGMRRVAVVIHLRAKDFHHVVSPVPFRCAESIYLPGGLLPTTPGGFHWIPAVLTLNERLVVHGVAEGRERATVAMALVGGTLSGRLSLAFDPRVRTNFLDPPAYAVRLPYDTPIRLPRGAPVGTFHWGSAVVLLADVPRSARWTCRTGEEVRAGMALLRS